LKHLIIHNIFEAPDNTQYNSRLKKREYENLLSYLNKENGENIVGEDIPIYQSIDGWDIDVPPYYKRGNKLIYNIKRYMLNNEIYTFDELKRTYKLSFRYKMNLIAINTIILLCMYYISLLDISQTIEAAIMIFLSISLFALVSITFFTFINVLEYVFPNNRGY